jgi:hypothetical protein
MKRGTLAAIYSKSSSSVRAGQLMLVSTAIVLGNTLPKKLLTGFSFSFYVFQGAASLCIVCGRPLVDRI